MYNLELGRYADRTILKRSVQEEILSDFRGTLRVVGLVILVVVLMLFLVVLAVVMVLVVVLLVVLVALVVVLVVSVVRYIGIPAGC